MLRQASSAALSLLATRPSVACSAVLLPRSSAVLGARTITAASPRASGLFEGLVSGSRNCLAKAITLVESTRYDDKDDASELLSMVLRSSSIRQYKTQDNFKSTFRIGLSGAPGVGKSSFIEQFGLFLIERGHKVAVLAVDPSSARTGGSILGDKTRMEFLSRHDDAFVRPSPSSCTLGGVARNTNEAILICEAAGYDIILVETVGVGQSETMVADMVDIFTLLVAPGGGDELQGMKRGIMELSDLVLVNKADGVLAVPARMAQMEYISALKFMQPVNALWRPEVLLMSAAEKKGIDEVWNSMKLYYKTMYDSKSLFQRRAEQNKTWMWRQITEELLWRLRHDPKVKASLLQLEESVKNGRITPGSAAEQVLHQFIADQQVRP
ncbi:arginine/ornithine transport system ATPase [Polychytrium aggregatum]|uniref:arginine/ornithine transport system ATPase n=1 Tax=Polychytrium aggregatum TaxID=110093 RepID=UPI0022FF3ECE|nr:arginine/ornithine transport system ATPase [Polychytrium aggregatum]KAI9193099.1 arginine/ornithine transport system ATPase [Polychytrium aggregatum]